MPSLEEARSAAGGCYAGASVYVFCGGYGRLKLNSVERLDTREVGKGWELIQLANEDLIPRTSLAVVALNFTDIVIFGGHAGGRSLSDAVIFDTETLQCKTVSSSDNQTFWAPGNQAAVVATNTVMAVVCS